MEGLGCLGGDPTTDFGYSSELGSAPGFMGLLRQTLGLVCVFKREVGGRLLNDDDRPQEVHLLRLLGRSLPYLLNPAACLILYPSKA